MFLIWLIAGLVLWGLLRVAWAVWRIYRGVHRFRRQMRQAMGQEEPRRGRRKDRQASQSASSPPSRRKIHPEDATDVAFTEIEVSRLTVNIASETDMRPVRDIDDVEWTEL